MVFLMPRPDFPVFPRPLIGGAGNFGKAKALRKVPFRELSGIFGKAEINSHHGKSI